MLDALVIPEDLESCQRLLHAAWAVEVELTSTCTTLQDRQEALQQENTELQLTIKHLLRQLYGRRSERLVEDRGQQHLAFGEEDAAGSDPSVVSAAPEEPDVQEFLVRRRAGRRQRSEQLPAHLERRTHRFEPRLPAGVRLEDCAPLGVDVVEILEFERGRLWVRRLEYPKYKLPASVTWPGVPTAPPTATAPPTTVEPALSTEPPTSAEPPMAREPHTGRESRVEATAVVCAASRAPNVPEIPAAEEPPPASTAAPDREPPPGTAVPPIAVASPMVEAHGILQAPREISLVEGGRFGFSVAAEVLFSKYGLHVPLHRQQDSLAQLGWSPSRSTLGLIVTHAAALLAPLADLFRRSVLASDVLGTDDTPVTLLTPGEGNGSREARFWLYRGRQAAPYDVFAFTDRRTRDGPDEFLTPFRGILSGDCYSGYVNIEQVTQGRIQFSACLGHARRYVFDAREQQPILGSQVLAMIRQLYDIEDRARPLTDTARWELRQRESVPVMHRLRELLDSPAAARVLPKSQFGAALGYLRNHWSAFQVYLHDGRVPIDNNEVERDLRRIAVGRSNWLFIGSLQAGERTATILTIMASAHRHDLDVWAYVRDALEQLARGRAAAGGEGHKIAPTILESLRPEVWAQAHPESVRTFRANEKQQRAERRRFQRAERRRTSGPE